MAVHRRMEMEISISEELIWMKKNIEIHLSFSFCRSMADMYIYSKLDDSNPTMNFKIE